MTDGRAPVQRRFTPARDTVVAVASHSFPKHPTLRHELLDSFPGARFNETGSPLAGAPLVDFLRGAAAAITGLERAFGARVIAHDIVSYQEFYRQNGVTPVSLARLLAEADIVTLHTPLDQSTRGLVGEREIAAMKPTSFLINAARGGIVDETALRSALVAGRIAGAALDVFEREPPDPAWFADVPNLLATPHIGASTEDARLAMGRAAIAGLLRSRESLDLTRKMAESKA